MKMHLFPSRVSLVCIGILLVSIFSSSVLHAATPPTPAGYPAGGLFARYFQNASSNPCDTAHGEVLTGFDSTATSNYFKTICSILFWESDGANKLWLRNTSSKVGIGLVNPQYTLDVNGTIRFDLPGTSSSGQVLMGDANGSLSWAPIPSTCLPGGTGMGNVCQGSYALSGNTTGSYNAAIGYGALRNKGAGHYNIAIGYNAGTGLVSGGGNIFIGTNTSPNISPTASYQLNIGNWIYGSGGRIGIADPTPRGTLDVNGQIIATNRLTLAQDSSTTSPTWHMDNSSDRFRIFRQPNITTVGTQVFAITNSGNVGIGIINPTSKLDVNGQIRTYANLVTSRLGVVGTYNAYQVQGIWSIGDAYKIDATNNHFGTQYGMVYAHTNAGSGIANKLPISGWGHQILFTSNGLPNAAISLSSGNAYFAGSVGIGTTTPSTKLDIAGIVRATGFIYSSDIRLKHNIRPLSSALQDILRLSGYSFQWNQTGKNDIGLIAQEVERVFPDLVHTDAQSGMKSVEYGNLVAPIIEAIKTQQDIIENQNEKIQSLERRLELLESKNE